jgi:hypothetical protein
MRKGWGFMKMGGVRKTVLALATLVLLALSTVTAAPAAEKNQDIPPFPGTLVNARYVYVTSYDGDQFNPSVLPQDRQAIASVQEAIEKWGKFTIVYKPQEADMVLMVESRPSEDILAVYDAHGWPKNDYLWRVTGRGGLQKGETPLVAQLKKAYEKAAK